MTVPMLYFVLGYLKLHSLMLHQCDCCGRFVSTVCCVHSEVLVMKYIYLYIFFFQFVYTVGHNLKVTQILVQVVS